MTLGKLIKLLESLPPNATVMNLHHPHSYRGHYDNLAFEHHPGTRPAIDLLTECKFANGYEFHGYKGGTYIMNANTPVWIADYGCCGKKLENVTC